jgi:serine/threonine-protein kinase RsbW
MTDPHGDEVVRLVLPATSRFLRIARLTAAGVAGDLGFGLQDVEDLRVAIDELCAALIEDADPKAELEIAYRIDGRVLEIDGWCPHASAPPELHPVAQELLSMTADDFRLEAGDGGRRFHLVKRRSDDAS